MIEPETKSASTFRGAHQGNRGGERDPGVQPQNVPELLEFLGDPRNHPDRPRRVVVLETHFAWVFLTGRFAWKMKKAMRQDRMDYRTLADRERGCREEVRLNRRLAPSVYLGVVALSRGRNGRIAWGRRGTIIEWVIRMRQLPAERMLDRVLACRALRDQDLDAVARMLARFYRRRAARLPFQGRDYLKRLRDRTTENARELRAPDLELDRRRVDAVIEAQRRVLQRAGPLLAARGARVLEGHGDLRPEHVSLGPPACAIDCLEFDRDLRTFDPAEELAFLALECARLGAPETGEALLRRCCAALGDPVHPAVLRFYMGQRALVRAKIAAWHLRDPQFTDRRTWIARAHSYLDDALRDSLVALELAGRNVHTGRMQARK